MADYKTEQDRLFEQLRDIADFAEAGERERQHEYRARVDTFVRMWIRQRLFDTPEEAREEVIRRMKARRKLPADFVYPDS